MKRPEITDEEIKGMMDFHQVLRAHHEAVASRTFKFWAYGVGVATVAVLLIYYVSQNSQSIVPSAPNPNPNPAKAIPELAKKNDTIGTKAIVQLPVKKQAPAQEPKPEKPQPQEAKSEASIVDVYQPAEPVEGYPHLYQYFNEKLKYPKEAAKDSIQGVVSVTFVVMPSGEIDRITITNSLGPLFDAEVTRVMKEMPIWKPAQLNHKPVSSKISIPLTFRIESLKN
ncbi:MAG: energy transducer TonB [Cyclobacteriaceae bacterium]|nr:energy transducer TonB [Cyclobacteriaceae bacterium]